jgi:zinc protease
VVIEGCLAAGSIDEPEELPGLASFTSGMLSRGTATRSFTKINEAIESVGAAIGFGADRYATDFSCKSLSEDLDLVLTILADELRNPAFPGEYVERVRGLRLTSIAERENDTRLMASHSFRKLLYGDHPLGRDPLGDRDSNGRIQRDDLLQHYRTFFHPAGMVIAVVGAVAAEEAVSRVEAAFGDWQGQRPERAPFVAVPPLEGIRRGVVPMPDKSQSDIYLGWPAMPRLHPDFDAARLANTVLGVFGLMGRLGENVREHLGMAYYVYSRLATDRFSGAWLTAAGVNPANTDRAVRAILDEVERLREETVSEEELEDSKRYLTGSLPLRLETNDGVAGLLVDMEWEGLGLDYLRRYAETVNAITPAQVQGVVRTYLDPSAYVLAVAGPQEGGGGSPA